MSQIRYREGDMENICPKPNCDLWNVCFFIQYILFIYSMKQILNREKGKNVQEIQQNILTPTIVSGGYYDILEQQIMKEKVKRSRESSSTNKVMSALSLFICMKSVRWVHTKTLGIMI